jgi:hypothetical protein
MFDERLPEYLGVKPLDEPKKEKPKHEYNPDVRCFCCERADFIRPPEEDLKHSPWVWDKGVKTESVFAAKHKPVALKTRPIYGELAEKY